MWPTFQQSELRVEILDAETLVLQPGFSARECIPMQGDHLQARVGWSNQSKWACGMPVRLRFYLQHAKLYSFWLA